MSGLWFFDHSEGPQGEMLAILYEDAAPEEYGWRPSVAIRDAIGGDLTVALAAGLYYPDFPDVR